MILLLLLLLLMLLLLLLLLIYNKELFVCGSVCHNIEFSIKLGIIEGDKVNVVMVVSDSDDDNEKK